MDFGDAQDTSPYRCVRPAERMLFCPPGEIRAISSLLDSSRYAVLIGDFNPRNKRHDLYRGTPSQLFSRATRLATIQLRGESQRELCRP